MRGARSSFLLCSIFLILYYIMSKTVVQSFSAHLARFSPTRCVGIFPCCARGLFRSLRERGRLQPPLLFLSARKRRAPCGCRRKRGLCAFGLRSNSNRCRASFRKALLLLRAPPESRCGREKSCVYPLAPEWAEPLRFRKGNAFEKKGCHVSESI